jgi:hypothetical protein
MVSGDNIIVGDIYQQTEAFVYIDTSNMVANIVKMASKMATENAVFHTLWVLPFLEQNIWCLLPKHQKTPKTIHK